MNRALFFAAFCLFTVIGFGAEKPKLPDGPGKETTEKLCGTCHGTNILMNRRESREGWSGIVEDMIQRGAKGEQDEFGDVVDYLTAHFSKTAPPPRVNVNDATVKALMTGLGIPESQANAVVQYRKDKGNFKTVEDLLKVPGLDAKAIDAKKDKIDF